MTATAPSGGTPEPRPDSGGNTTGRTTPDPAASGGTPPPTPVPPPPSRPPDVPARPSGTPDGEGEDREGFWRMVAEALGVAPGSSLRKRLITLAVLAAVASVVPFYDALVDHLLSDRKTEQANESNKEYDAGQQPFTVTVRP